MDESVDPSLAQLRFPIAWSPCEIKGLGPGSLEHVRGINGLAGVHFVRAAQAGEVRARGLECCSHCVAPGEAIVRHRLDASGLEEVLGEVRARAEVGAAAEI